MAISQELFLTFGSFSDNIIKMSGSHLFQIINLLIILVVFIFLIRYVWDIFFSESYNPVSWQYSVKEGKISRKLLSLEKKFPDKVRFFNFWFQVERLKKTNVQGAFAEAGVYKGESAAVLHHMDADRVFHLFDTFSGFPAQDLMHETGEAATYTTKNFADTNISTVLKKIEGNTNLQIHQGYFPDTTKGLENEMFSLVNLDLDLYHPTKAALGFFYPRLSPSGVIIIHDYNPKWEGICKAVDEFIADEPEPLIMVPDSDGTCMIIKQRIHD
jgi:O-methyltransferase